MSQRDSPQDDEVELSLRLRGLSITVRGPPGEATAFVASVTSGSSDRRAPSPTSTIRSFELVPSQLVEAPRVETRDQIQSSFRSCPGRLLAQSTRLGVSRAAAENRINRSWVAGQWAKAVLDGRIHSPNRSEPLALRSRYYSVARCQGLECPVIFQSSGSYWRAVRSFEESNSISHAFPSELEARIYLEGAGFEEEVAVRP